MSLTNHEDTVNALCFLSPKALCALVWEVLDDKEFSDDAYVRIFNALYAWDNQDLTIYDMEDLDEVMCGLSATELLDSLTTNYHPFTTDDLWFAINQTTGLWESARCPADLDPATRNPLKTWKSALRGLTIESATNYNKFDDFRYAIIHEDAAVHQLASELIDILSDDLGYEHIANDLDWEELIPAFERKAPSLDLFTCHD